MDDDALKADVAYQTQILQDVSRTFALTIPQLPYQLRTAVGNAYLLCRIADTIEDESALTTGQKREFSEGWIGLVEGRGQEEEFVSELSPLLIGSTTAAERDLIININRIIRILDSLSAPQRKALERCVKIMSSGMVEFQEVASLEGLSDLKHLERYCYFVAGVVGEMLTELFCDYSSEIDARRSELFALAVSFGQGLQMTNILKDIWDDRERGSCWLPRSEFQSVGFKLSTLAPGQADPCFVQGLNKMIGIARLRLKEAFDYVLLVPAHETGIRRFCLWSLGMALLTLRRVYFNPGFGSGQEVKISRRSVKAVIAISNTAARYDTALRLLHMSLSRQLPAIPKTASRAV